MLELEGAMETGILSPVRKSWTGEQLMPPKRLVLIGSMGKRGPGAAARRKTLPSRDGIDHVAGGHRHAGASTGHTVWVDGRVVKKDGQLVAAGAYDDPRMKALSYAILAPNPHNRQAAGRSKCREYSNRLPRTNHAKSPRQTLSSPIGNRAGLFSRTHDNYRAQTGHGVDLANDTEGEKVAWLQAVAISVRN